jgi:hypothetical protein
MDAGSAGLGNQSGAGDQYAIAIYLSRYVGGARLDATLAGASPAHNASVRSLSETLHIVDEVYQPIAIVDFDLQHVQCLEAEDAG